jgi:mannose-6-phosphate isomerase-like protein (cupin superfamily)
MMRRWSLLVLGLFLTVSLSAPAGRASSNQASDSVVSVIPTQLQWTSGPPSLPNGARYTVLEGDPNVDAPLTIRLTFPKGYRMPAHFHPVTERVTVISGSIYVGLGKELKMDEGKKMPVGSFVSIPAGEPHFAWTTEEAIIQVQGNGRWEVTYMDPGKDPRNA